VAETGREKATDNFLQADYQAIIEKLKSIEEILKMMKSSAKLDNHNRALVEQIKNDV
jgi:hypothetical protein